MGASALRVVGDRLAVTHLKLRNPALPTHPVIHPLDPDPHPLGDRGVTPTTGRSGDGHGEARVAMTAMTMKIAKKAPNTSSIFF
ncbi:hypothetical protein GCM10010234_37680 [Streptomyces hawaiiensis]